jgi:hypothetical protein
MRMVIKVIVVINTECSRRNHPAQPKTQMCYGTRHQTLEAQNISIALSTHSFKMPDDDQSWSKHAVYNVVLNKFKRLTVYMQ